MQAVDGEEEGGVEEDGKRQVSTCFFLFLFFLIKNLVYDRKHHACFLLKGGRLTGLTRGDWREADA